MSSFGHSIAWRTECAASSSGMVTRRRGLQSSAPRSASLLGVDGAGPLPLPIERCFRFLPRGRAVAPQLLSDLRYAASNGPVSRQRSWPPAASFLRLLRHALAIPTSRVPVLPKHGRSSALGPDDRGREIPSHRLLSVLPGLHQNL